MQSIDENEIRLVQPTKKGSDLNRWFWFVGECNKRYISRRDPPVKYEIRKLYLFGQ